MNKPIVISGISIRQDTNRRFCLNDLHKAAGGEPRSKVNNWLHQQHTQALVAEVDKAGIPAISANRGRYGGTYALKELVYWYASWISPLFHLQVIRAYDAMARVAEPEHVLPSTLAQSLRDMADLLEKNEELKAELAVVQVKAGFHDRVGDSKGSQSFSEVGMVHSLTGNALIKILAAKGILYTRGGPWLAKQPFITKGYFITRLTTTQHGYNVTQTRVTGKGQQFIADLIGETCPA